MVTDLTELHQGVVLKQVLVDDESLTHKVCWLQEFLVDFQLQIRQTNADIDFNLVGQLSDTVSLGASQHEWFKDAMQDLDH